MKVHGWIMAIAAGSLLAGCQTASNTPQNTAKVGQVPANYRELTLAYFKSTLKDPYSVRDAQISGPTVIFVGLLNGGNVPGVCVSMNAKNSFGAYTGVQTTAVGFRNGTIFWAAGPSMDSCSNVNWQPFSELNGAG